MALPPFYVGPGDYLNVSVELDSNKSKILTANLLQVEGSYPNLPGDIFIYENTGTTTLGTYIGVANLDELTRLQVFDINTAIPIFGNRYVRHSEAKIILGLNDDPAPVITVISKAITNLSTELKAKGTYSSIVYIP